MEPAAVTPVPVSPAAPRGEQPAKPSIEEVVEEWFRAHFHALGASLPEHLYNHLHAAKDALKERLRDLA